jgi:hypothetical protein
MLFWLLALDLWHCCSHGQNQGSASVAMWRPFYFVTGDASSGKGTFSEAEMMNWWHFQASTCDWNAFPSGNGQLDRDIERDQPATSHLRSQHGLPNKISHTDDILIQLSFAECIHHSQPMSWPMVEILEKSKFWQSKWCWGERVCTCLNHSSIDWARWL